VSLARITSEDPFAGLPEREEFGQLEGDLGLYFEDVKEQPPAERIEIARRTEAAAMAYDTRIQNSRGGDFDTATSHKIMMNSRGFVGEYRRSYCGFSVSPIAHDEKGSMQRNYWFSNARTVTKLEDPEEIGHIAARRTLQRLGARQVKTQKAPVVFSAEMAQSIIGNIFDAANGDAIYRHASFFSGMLGERVAGARVLDLYCGTGALAIEALSRGADRAILVDRDTRPALGNIERLGLGPRAELVRADVGSWLERVSGGEEAGTFDLVFVDAPYRLADRVGQELDSQLPGLLSEGGRAIVESGARRPLRIDSLPRLRQRRYGAADVSIYGGAAK